MEYLCTCITQHTPGRLVLPCPLPPHSTAEPRQGKGDVVVSLVMVVLPSMRCNYLPATIVRRCLDIEKQALVRPLFAVDRGTSRRPGQRLPCVGRWCTDGWWWARERQSTPGRSAGGALFAAPEELGTS